jgi:hypothetical protein
MDSDKGKEWLSSHHPIYLMDGDNDTFREELINVKDNIPHVLVWSARGMGLQSNVCDIHVTINVLCHSFNSPSVSRWPKIIFVCQKYGAKSAAAQVFEQSKKTSVVIWASKEVETTDIFELVKATERIVCEMQISSAGLYGTTASTRRKKHEIQSYKIDSNALLNLDVKTFKYKPEIDAEQSVQYGFIAEEAQELGLDELIQYDETGVPDYFAYEKLPIFLLQLAQEQEARIQALEGK